MSIPLHLATHMQRLARRRVLLVSGALCVGLAGVMFASSGTGSLAAVADRCGQPAPDVRFTTSPEGVHQFLDACGEAGRAAYRDLQVLDLLYPAAVGVFLASALALVLTKAARRARRPALPALAALPLLASACDYVENTAAWILLLRHPDQQTGVATILGTASALKQVLTWASIVLLAGGLVGALVIRLRHRSVPAAPAT
jgi:hypothetical protein